MKKHIFNNQNKDVNGINITVIGLGKSGQGAAKLANYLGASVFVSDSISNSNLKEKSNYLESCGIEVELGNHSDKIFDSKLWILSPGVPQNSSILIEAKSMGIQLISEIEFASWYAKHPIICITGSNGKTTTVNLIEKMCDSESLNPILGGNVGTAFSEIILNDLENKPNERLYILEISSFQLEHIISFKPFISVFLNITPDHLDRYLNMEEYVNAKLNMIMNQTEKEHIIFNLDDDILRNELMDVKPQVHGFSLEKRDKIIFNVNATKIYSENENELIDLKDFALPGKHNLSNALAAATASRLIGVPDEYIKSTMINFKGVEHRLEFVKNIGGVSYYNDSKATNLDSVKVALDSFDNKIYLLMGGQDKGGNFLDLIPYLKNKVKKIITFGQASGKVSKALRDAVRLKKVEDLKDAVELSHMNAVPGDIVLLSPGCASFDQFANFEERGFEFKKLVKEIAEA